MRACPTSWSGGLYNQLANFALSSIVTLLQFNKKSTIFTRDIGSGLSTLAVVELGAGNNLKLYIF